MKFVHRMGQIALALIASAAVVPVILAQSFSPYSDFQGMSQADTQNLQIKLTFAGPRKDTMPTVAFTPGTLDLTKFAPFRRPTISYGMDSGLEAFVASTAEMKAVLNGIGTLANVTAGGVSADQWLSFAMVWTISPVNIKGFEAIVSKTDAAAVFAQLRTAFANNKAGLMALGDMACPIGATDPVVPTDVTSQSIVSYSGLRLNRTTGRFVGTASVKNNSASTFIGPVSLVMDLPGSITLYNSDGTTCNVKPTGRFYINVSSGPLAAGATAQVNLDIANPDSEPVTPSTKVLAGPGGR